LGEEIAASYLESRGYTIAARNLRTPHGEIDLVAEKDGAIIFVEVKTRSGRGYGMPEEAVTRAKRDHLLSAIAWYWQQAEGAETEWRVDVIAVMRQGTGKEIEVEHFENAIQA
jgi:putative endonuclease